MLTKNFYSYMRAVLQNVSADFALTSGGTQLITISGTRAPFAVMNIWAIQYNTYGVSFGTGTTPATMSDYRLENMLGETQINVSVQSAVSYSRADTYDEYSATFGITNKTAEAITISEVGLTTMPNSSYYALVDHTVLETPITIPAGQSKQITYTIRFNYGDAV